MNMPPVTGRFAPSPTGKLHFGSLVAAVGSYVDAKSRGGQWLIRIEDIDPPREIEGSASGIIDDLARFGLVADQPVMFQSTRYATYEAAIKKLLHEDRAFPCACSRRDIPASGVYPGTCRQGVPAGKTPRSIRFRSDDSVKGFYDLLQGQVAGEVDDFVIKRADGLIAYQLAVVVDDEYQAVTEVVRGADLIESTTRQIALQGALGYSTPEYIHLPVALSGDGKKLSKRDASDPICNLDGRDVVTEALSFLGHKAPPGLPLPDLWDWAFEHWDRRRIPQKTGVSAS